MNQKNSRIIALIAMAAVLVYTVINYLNGRADLSTVLIAAAFLGIPMLNILNQVIQDRE